MSFNLESLKRVPKANSRSSQIDYDLAYSEKTEKFRVSPDFYDKVDMQNNGLTAIEDVKQGILYIAVEPNEKAVMHKGRGGDTTKGKEFTASRLRAKLDDYGYKGVNEFDLTQVHQEGDMTIYSIEADEEGATSEMGEDRDVSVVPDESRQDEAADEVGSMDSQPADDSDAFSQEDEIDALLN